MPDKEIEEFLHRLARDGLKVVLSEDGEKIVLDTTYVELKDIDRERLKQYKPEIIRYLKVQAWDIHAGIAESLVVMDMLQDRLELYTMDRLRGILQTEVAKMPRDQARDYETMALADQIKAEVVQTMMPHLETLWEAVNARDMYAIRKRLSTLVQSLEDVLASRVGSVHDSSQSTVMSA